MRVLAAHVEIEALAADAAAHLDRRADSISDDARREPLSAVARRADRFLVASRRPLSRSLASRDADRGCARPRLPGAASRFRSPGARPLEDDPRELPFVFDPLLEGVEKAREKRRHTVERNLLFAVRPEHALELQPMQRTFPPGSARRFLTTGTAAQLASCHRTTILRAIERGQLEAMRLGPTGAHRIPFESFEEWLQPAGLDHQETAK